LADWEGHGFEEFILITAHFHDPHLDAVTTVVTEHARVRVVDLQSVRIREFLDKQSGPEHAGEADTAVMMYVAPELVRGGELRDYPLDEKQVRRYLRGRMPKPPPGCEGAIGHPSAADGKKGEEIYLHVLDKVRTKIFLEPPEDE
nr:creatininase family protein [Gemmatimonadota bacterium]NIR74966.1 creatininase family protein [Candidatus Kutchimonas denitrificans]NIS01549.1 creatininase family protein [Gemmatimonadota bacterium]NIT67287.1 creatininase family protein [Gemmatimonadota bacterium]NIU52650.1 creatininase family protein [Gemmatimonadota bacterium]